MSRQTDDQYFRSMVQASEPARLEWQRHIRVKRTLEALKAWDLPLPTFFRFLRFERDLHASNVLAIRSSAMYIAYNERARFKVEKAQTKELLSLDPYAVLKQRTREQIEEWRRRMFDRNLEPEEFKTLSEQAKKHMRALIKADKATIALQKLAEEAAPSLRRLRILRGD